jgi:hypothetical protein
MISNSVVKIAPPKPVTGLKSEMPPMVFIVVFVLHVIYIRRIAATPSTGWADSLPVDGFLGLGPYFRAQEYYVGFSYALGAAFAAWAALQFIRSRRVDTATGAAGGVTLVGVLMTAGCFLLGCCGSPMLAVYAGIFGAKALGASKMIMALVTLLSVSCGYWCLSRRMAQGDSPDTCCPKSDCR